MKRISIARRLRRNLTDAEALLWSRLRNRHMRGFKFRRQMPIGKYVTDFACEEARVAIEVDGGQHTEARDRLRTDALEAAGYLVLRFWNNDVLADIDVVVAEIDRVLATRPKSPAPA